MQVQGENPPPTKHQSRPSTNIPFTVADAIFICRISIPALFRGDSQAERISGKVFDDDFMSCMDNTVK